MSTGFEQAFGSRETYLNYLKYSRELLKKY